MKKTLAMMSAALCLITSCSERENFPGSETDDKHPLSLSVITAQISRSLITGNSLDDGTRIGVTLTDTRGETYDGIEYSNICFTAEGNGSSQSWSPEQEIMLSSSKAVLYAYHPYSDEVNDISNIIVKADSENQTDYMYATPVTELNNHNHEADVQLQHALSAVRVSITRGSYSGTGRISSISINGENMATEGILDARNGQLSSLKGIGSSISPAISPITIGSSPAVFDILAIPSGRRGSIGIEIHMDGETFEIDTDPVNLSQGTVSVIDVTINNSSVTVVPVKVSQWTYSNAAQSSLGKGWSVYLEGDMDGISFSNTAGNDGTVIITATPDFEDAEVNQVTVTGDVTFSESIDEDTGSRTIVLSDVNSDVTVNFSSYCLWVTATYDITNTTGNTTLLYHSSYPDKTQCVRMKVDGTETSASNFYRFTTTGTHTVRFTFPDKTLIPESAFYNNANLISIRIPEGVTKLSTYAFYNCIRLSDVRLPQTLTSSGYDVFSYNSSLKSIILPDNLVPGYSFLKNCTALENVTLPKNLKYIPSLFLARCSSLKQVIIPDSVTSIDEYAFESSGLTSLTIPEKTTSLPKRLCSGCSSLETVTLHSGIKTIGEGAFLYCSSLRTVRFGSNTEEYNICFPEGMTSIGENAFSFCDLLNSVSIPSTLNDIGNAALASKSMTYVTVSGSNTKYEKRGDFNGIVEKATDKLIFGCSNATVIPESITKIGDYAYYNIPITDIDLHEGISYIGDCAFSETYTLKTIISRSSTPPATGTKEVFSNPARWGKLKVPSGSVDAYKASSWMGTSKSFLGFYKWSVIALENGE